MFLPTPPFIAKLLAGDDDVIASKGVSGQKAAASAGGVQKGEASWIRGTVAES